VYKKPYFFSSSPAGTRRHPRGGRTTRSSMPVTRTPAKRWRSSPPRSRHPPRRCGCARHVATPPQPPQRPASGGGRCVGGGARGGRRGGRAGRRHARAHTVARSPPPPRAAVTDRLPVPPAPPRAGTPHPPTPPRSAGRGEGGGGAEGAWPGPGGMGRATAVSGGAARARALAARRGGAADGRGGPRAVRRVWAPRGAADARRQMERAPPQSRRSRARGPDRQGGGHPVLVSSALTGVTPTGVDGGHLALLRT